jgi:hypothetical protein
VDSGHVSCQKMTSRCGCRNNLATPTQAPPTLPLRSGIIAKLIQFQIVASEDVDYDIFNPIFKVMYIHHAKAQSGGVRMPVYLKYAVYGLVLVGG